MYSYTLNIGFPNKPGVRYRNLFIPRVKKPPSANNDFTKIFEKVWKFMKANAFIESYRNNNFFECDLFAFLCSMENCLQFLKTLSLVQILGVN